MELHATVSGFGSVLLNPTLIWTHCTLPSTSDEMGKYRAEKCDPRTMLAGVQFTMKVRCTSVFLERFFEYVLHED